MSGMRFWGRFLCIAALLSFAASVHAQTTSPGMSLDDEYTKMAEKVPGFGGLYLDEKGTTHVYLQDLARAGEMQGLADRVIFEQGDYDFRDLYAWREQLRPELTAPGAVYLDIDERRNRIVFGAQPELLDKFTADLQSFLRGTKVPPEAVAVEPSSPFQPLELLTDRIRPVPAGVQISWPALGSVKGGACTLGINATRLGVRGFVTASHCTATRSAVDGRAFSQNVPGGNQIGVETVDPPFIIGGSCPAGRKCRRSDAAFAAYDSTSLSAGGKIANPLFWGWGAGTLTVNPVTPRLPVTGFLFGSVSSGAVEYKVGRTTGGTFGSVTNTCTDIVVLDDNLQDTGITMLCQDMTSIGSGKGDSGSPIFVQSGGKATLAGILWGGNGSATVYSPWLFVFAELGGAIFPDAP